MSGRYVRIEPVDLLVLDGEGLALYPDQFVRLGPLGTCLVAAAEAPRTIDDLADALTDAFGSPPPDGDAVNATRAAIADLVAQGVLREVDGV